MSVIHSQIQDPDGVVRGLAGLLDMEESEIRKKVEKVSSIERIRTNVDKETGDQIRALGLAGVKVDEDYKRYYPYDELASKVLGFTGGDNQGIIGLEVIYEEYLKGIDGKILTTTDARGIELGYFNYVDEDVVVIADAEQMKRVINNIIGNSVKYIDKKKGIINIRIKDVGDFIEVEIEDNGKGIAQKDLPNIFDRFYRADSSRNSSKGGSGIGLSIVRKIIEDHGGKIWATSKEGIGTEIHFVLRKYQEVIQE